ncbi:MAG: superfamily hydrolase [Rickettsiaceae bacterium]|jgi:HAD superfamily hydrolase (TIGR01509 family)|nr:superfamily hydrolase [Rickettsiaceae bacterium]
MNNYDLIIFDCDGTLVDSEVLNNKAVSEGLVSLGLTQYTPEYCLDNLAGCSRQYVRAIIEREVGGKVDFDLLGATITERCLKLHESELTAVAGMVGLVSAVQLPKCIASNGNRKAVFNSLAVTKLDIYFEENHIFTGEMVREGKPAPDILLLAAQTLGYQPERCLVIEDSVSGIKAAKAAGMTVFGFLGAGHSNERIHAKIEQEKPDRIIFNAQEMLEIISAF